MGSFDRVIFRCPDCGHKIEAQSKEGHCEFSNFAPYEVPLAIAEDWVYCNDQARTEKLPKGHEGYYNALPCGKCGRLWDIHVDMPTTAVCSLTPHVKPPDASRKNDY